MAHSLPELTGIGTDLQRPECVLATADGRLHVSDWRGGVTVILPDAQQRTLLARDHHGLRPNGIALEPDGAYLLAHLGDDAGGVYRLHPDGGSQALLLEIDGTGLPPTNFPCRDHQGRLWVTVSSRHQPRAAAYRPDIADGFIVLVDQQGARIAADGLCYTNECWVDPSGGFLFVNETFGRRLTRFAVAPDGSLTDRTVVAQFGAGTFPDGLVVDADGWFWITSIVSNRVLRVAPDGRRQTVVLEDVDQQHLDWVETAFQAGTMGRPHLDTGGGRELRNISSLAFGGADGRTAYLGCLLGQRITSFDPGVAGQPPAHWLVASGVGTATR